MLFPIEVFKYGNQVLENITSFRFQYWKIIMSYILIIIIVCNILMPHLRLFWTYSRCKDWEGLYHFILTISNQIVWKNFSWTVSDLQQIIDISQIVGRVHLLAKLAVQTLQLQVAGNHGERAPQKITFIVP